MYLMYVDESGDDGNLPKSPTEYFVLSGLVVHELRWREVLENLVEFRRRIRDRYGLKLREEIHAFDFISKPGPDLIRIRRNDRLAILRAFANELSRQTDLSIINIVVDKKGKPENYDVFSNAWTALIQRFENTLSYRNFNGPANADDKGMILPDDTNRKKLVNLLRKMRHYNPIPHDRSVYLGGYRNLPVRALIEDPFFKDSEHSYFSQACDVAAYFLYQKLKPNAYIRKKGAHIAFEQLDSILCKQASAQDPQGIVRL